MNNIKILDGKTLLITGGTGSFGNAVIKKCINSKIKEIRVFSRDEKKQDDMRHKYQEIYPEMSSKLKFYIGDVRNIRCVDDAMEGVDYIFHAAALKQVPSCEFFPLEAVKTNIFGTNNVLDSAIKHNVKKTIVLSTDKATYPINAMGMTKALMEKVASAKSRNLDKASTTICCTRYGNVMGSRGSVIPLFMQQITDNKPITVTNPKMTRFMMTLEDAVDLVLYAFNYGKQGDLFVQKAPSATIDTLAKAIKIYMNSDTPIKYIGTRHGEKLYEILVTKEEMVKATDLGKYYRIPFDSRNMNYDLYLKKGNEMLDGTKEYTSHNTNKLDVKGMLKLIKQMKES